MGSEMCIRDSNNDLFMQSGVCHIGISDHSLIFAVQSRQFRNFDGDLFRTDLSLVPWHLVDYEVNPCMGDVVQYVSENL